MEVPGELQHFIATSSRCSYFNVRQWRDWELLVISICLMVAAPILVPLLTLMVGPLVLVLYPYEMIQVCSCFLCVDGGVLVLVFYPYEMIPGAFVFHVVCLLFCIVVAAPVVVSCSLGPFVLVVYSYEMIQVCCFSLCLCFAVFSRRFRSSALGNDERRGYLSPLVYLFLHIVLLALLLYVESCHVRASLKGRMLSALGTLTI